MTDENILSARIILLNHFCSHIRKQNNAERMAQMSARTSKKVGRPPMSPDGPKRAAIGLRASNELRARLKAAATKSGRSLSQEAEIRLEQSFESDSAFGGAEQAALLRMMAAAAQMIEARTGRGWQDDYNTAFAVYTAWQRLIVEAMPSMSDEDQATVSAKPPEMPAAPNWADFKPEGGLAQSIAPDYDATMEAYRRALDEYLAKANAVVGRLGKAKDLGDETAAALFPERKAK